MKNILLITFLVLGFSMKAQEKPINTNDNKASKPIPKSNFPVDNKNKDKKISELKNMNSVIQQNQPIVAMPKRGFAVDWIQPKSSEANKIGVYKKIELGIHFPDTLTKQINSFVENGEGIYNPFDPNDINIYAEFEFFENNNWVKKNKINGFYYQDFVRDIKTKNIDTWVWNKISTDDFFRIRFSPSKVGKWRFRVKVLIKNTPEVIMGEFEFNCTESNNKGFVKIANDKKHFSLGKMRYTPIGQNLPSPTCYFQKDEKGNVMNDTLKCITCPCAGIEGNCAKLRHLPMHPKTYMAYLEEITALKKTGANYFRMINYPYSFEIEYEKLGNYSGRMHCVWELDQVLEKAERFDLKINLNLFDATFFNAKESQVWNWNNSKENQEYCYKSQLKLSKPLDFLTNQTAKTHFKNRLRYYVARYGYSTSILMLELMNEINTIFPDNPKEVYDWNQEMTKYIKEELQHENQLLTINYNQNGPNLEKGDNTYSLNTIDVISQNVTLKNVLRSDLSLIVSNNMKYNKPFIFAAMNSTVSSPDFCKNDADWLINCWTGIFLETASTGINWENQHNQSAWDKFKHLKKFFNGIEIRTFITPSYALRKDKLTETFVLIDSLKHKAFGVIQNTTWNNNSSNTSESCKQNTDLINTQNDKFIAVKLNKEKCYFCLQFRFKC